MGALFSPPDIPKPSIPQPAKVDDNTTQNAVTAERLRRMRAVGKQQSIFAGDSLGAPNLITSKLGGGM